MSLPRTDGPAGSLGTQGGRAGPSVCCEVRSCQEAGYLKLLLRGDGPVTLGLHLDKTGRQLDGTAVVALPVNGQFRDLGSKALHQKLSLALVGDGSPITGRIPVDD